MGVGILSKWEWRFLVMVSLGDGLILFLLGLDPFLYVCIGRSRRNLDIQGMVTTARPGLVPISFG